MGSGRLVSEVTYHEVEIDKTSPHVVNHPEGSVIFPLEGVYIGHGGKDSGGWLLRYVLIGEARPARHDESETS